MKEAETVQIFAAMPTGVAVELVFGPGWCGLAVNDDNLPALHKLAEIRGVVLAATEHHRVDESWRDPEEDAKAGCL
jgi:hypothetical protein